MINWINPGNQR